MASISLLYLAPSTRHWEVIAMARRSAWVSSGKRHVRNSQFLSSQLGLYICGDISSRSSSSWNWDASLSRNDWRAQSSILFWQVCFFYRACLPLHWSRQWVISTSPFSQSILGLWSLSQLQPRIRLCFPRPETARSILLE